MGLGGTGHTYPLGRVRVVDWIYLLLSKVGRMEGLDTLKDCIEGGEEVSRAITWLGGGRGGTTATRGEVGLNRHLVVGRGGGGIGRNCHLVGE